jgi:hypothetical protein
MAQISSVSANGLHAWMPAVRATALRPAEARWTGFADAAGAAVPKASAVAMSPATLRMGNARLM